MGKENSSSSGIKPGNFSKLKRKIKLTQFSMFCESLSNVNITYMFSRKQFATSRQSNDKTVNIKTNHERTSSEHLSLKLVTHDNSEGTSRLAEGGAHTS